MKQNKTQKKTTIKIFISRLVEVEATVKKVSVKLNALDANLKNKVRPINEFNHTSEKKQE